MSARFSHLLYDRRTLTLLASQYSRSSSRPTVPFISGLLRHSTRAHQRFIHHLATKDKAEMKWAAKKVAEWDFGECRVSLEGSVANCGAVRRMDTVLPRES